MGQGHTENIYTEVQTSGNTVIIVIKEHKIVVVFIESLY